MTDTKELLKPEPLARPMDRAAMGNDQAALRELVSFLNNPEITGAKVSDAAKTEITAATHPTPAITTPPPVAPPAKVIDGSKIFYTGKLKAGKDYVAGLTKAKIFGFSEPLYFLLKYFFGVTNKDQHGARKFLQQVGQWGRGVINEQYPVTPERAVFVDLVRAHAAGGFFDVATEKFHVDWLKFGHDDNIWLDAVAARMQNFLSVTPGARVATTNVRFEHEFKRMQELGFRHYHVMTSPQEWSARLQKDGLNSASPAVNDYSEKLAQALDGDVTRKISAQRNGPKLNVIWNSATPPPSPRLYTVAEFLLAVNVTPDAAAGDTMVV